MNLTITPIRNINSNYNYKQVRFSGWQRTCILPTPDVFECQMTKATADKIFDDLISSIDKKFHANLMEFTPQKLENAIQNLLKELPETTEKEVLTVMQRLTQWANYSCLSKLTQKLSDAGINSLHKYGGINNCFDYLKRSKGLIPCTGNSKAYFITKNTINDNLQSLPTETKFINLEGFDDGINLFSDDEQLESVSKKALLSINKLRKKYPELSFAKALDVYLNGKVAQEMRTLGLNFQTIRLEAEPTREVILKQMKPFAPDSKDTIRTTIETIAEFFTKKNAEYLVLRNNIADFYESKLDVYSKQRLISNIKLLSKQINQYLKRHHLSEDNLYIMVPNEQGQNKSFGLITEMFARINNISAEKIVRIEDIQELNKYPEKSVFILPDDLTCSGDALSKISSYDQQAWFLGKDKHILFCPIVANSQGLDKINEAIEFAKRTHNDKTLTIKKNIKERSMAAKDVKRDEYFREDRIGNDAFGFEGYDNGEECLVFPYTAPDNNADLSSFITQYFLPSHNALKSRHIAFYTINLKIQNALNRKNIK